MTEKFGCSEEALTIAAMLQVQHVFTLPSRAKAQAVSWGGREGAREGGRWGRGEGREGRRRGEGGGGEGRGREGESKGRGREGARKEGGGE